MQVAIDIRRISDFGVGTYIRNIVRALSRLDRENKYYLIGAPEKVQEIGLLAPNFHNIAFTERDTSARGYFGFRTVLRRLNCDLVHVPHLFWLPRALPCPYVMTVHAVSYTHLTLPTICSV